MKESPWLTIAVLALPNDSRIGFILRSFASSPTNSDPLAQFTIILINSFADSVFPAPDSPEIVTTCRRSEMMEVPMAMRSMIEQTVVLQERVLRC